MVWTAAAAAARATETAAAAAAAARVVRGQLARACAVRNVAMVRVALADGQRLVGFLWSAEELEAAQAVERAAAEWSEMVRKETAAREDKAAYKAAQKRQLTPEEVSKNDERRRKDRLTKAAKYAKDKAAKAGGC